jgi:ABC-2 type transport system permease protein
VSRIWLVLKREYLENVRTRAFLIGLVLTPVWMVLVFVVPMLARDSEKVERVVVVDETGELAAPVVAEIARIPGSSGEPRFDAQTRLEVGNAELEEFQRAAGRGELFLIVLTPALLENKREKRASERAAAVYGASGVGALEAGRVLESAVDRVVNRTLIARHQVPEEVAAALQRTAARYTGLTAKGEKSGAAQVMAPFLAMMLLFMGIVGISQMLISSTLEEKASRIFEVLLSSLSPFQLMAGKVLGICAVGLTLLLLWTGGGLFAAALQGASDLVTVPQMGLFVAYYVLGFLLIASLMVSVGSACNTLKEAQNLMAPLSLLLALPLLIAIVIMKNPNGTMATVLSFVPPFTPFLMMARIAGTPPPPTWQIAASLLLLAVSTWFAIRLAARVFRVGILMYGQPPRLKELFRWMRTP